MNAFVCVYSTVMPNDDEGIDIEDHQCAGLAMRNSVNSADDDFSDAGRFALSSLRVDQHSAVISVNYIYNLPIVSFKKLNMSAVFGWFFRTFFPV